MEPSAVKASGVYGENSKCDHECGTMQVTGTIQDGSTFAFVIGEGVKYEPSDQDCFGECFAPESGSMSCGKRFEKVAKNTEGRKLCCKQHQCQWHPGENKWQERMEVKEEYLHITEKQSASLHGSIGVSKDGKSEVPANSCLCCTKKVLWGPEVNTHCQMAFSATYLFGRPFHSSFHSAKCQTHCASFPEFPVYLKTISAKKWDAMTPSQVSASIVTAKLTDGIAKAMGSFDGLAEEAKSNILWKLEDGIYEAEVMDGAVDADLIARAQAALDEKRPALLEFEQKPTKGKGE